MNRPICEKIGDWNRLDYPTMDECSKCKSEKCPIQALIRSVKFNYTLIKSWHGEKKNSGG